ncbi:hypothetical protein SSTU70S_03329 [Stutzerimonas stutzeri]
MSLLEVELELAVLVDDQLEEIQQFGDQRGVGRHQRRQVGVADDGHTVAHHHLIDLGQRAVTAMATARSTITEPGFICSTVASCSSVGALRPGISAVVMTMSDCSARSCTACA